MSVVTSAILTMVPGEEEFQEALAKINAYFDDKFCKGFVSVEDAEPRCYGGNKALQISLAIGAFNYLNLKGLVDHIKKVTEPDDSWPVQLFVQEEEECGLRIITVHPPGRPERSS